MSDLDSFLRAQKRWRRYSSADLAMATDEVIIAADGKLSRADAKRYARAALEAVGLEKLP